ncbi:MAG: hypothetical protein K6V36_10580 [Anaerolineae bacterium]|nr:hypothetical protein [Anaerolineae bacterium]
MPLSEAARAIVRFLAEEDRGQRGCDEETVRARLHLTDEAYEAALSELLDYGLIGPTLAAAGETGGRLVVSAEGREALARGFAPESLPLTPIALARNPIVAASWAIDRLAAAQELPEGRDALADEIVLAVLGLLQISGECLPPDTIEMVQAAAETLMAEVRRPAPRLDVIRDALRVLGFPDGTLALNSPLVTALPALASAIDALLV